MADSKMAVSQWSTEFVQDLLPAAQKTALLYHLSYLCLAKFPNLERIIRARAVETQLLFGSSDATLLKCILTSENLVNSLFPILKTAVERNKPNLAVKLLKKAQSWIQDIITDVKEIVQKYDLHNRDVATSTSDVIQEKADTDKKITEQDQALKEIEITLNDWKSKLQKSTAELAETENKISSKTQEIQDFVSSISETRKGLGIFAAIVPFVGPLVKGIYEAIKNPGQAEHIRALEAELNVLIAEKTDLRRKQWQVDLQIIDWQMKAARASFDRSSIPDPVHLNEVQKSLSKIQKILIQLKDFWEKVGEKLDSLEKKTFVGKDLVEDLSEIKDVFFDSIEVATEAWISFGVCCQRASAIFRLQTRDAYSFLEVSPSSLSKDQWQVQYEIVKKHLEKIDPPGALMSSNTPALSE